MWWVIGVLYAMVGAFVAGVAMYLVQKEDWHDDGVALVALVICFLMWPLVVVAGFAYNLTARLKRDGEEKVG